MHFVSLVFIVFIAIVFMAYYAMPRNTRWIALLVASYVFYWLNSEWLILVMFAQTAVTFLCGRWMQVMEARGITAGPDADRSVVREQKAALRSNKRKVMALGIVINLGALLFLKYHNFFADCANVVLKLAGLQIPSLGLLLPIGISFYTLQAIAYLSDISRGKIEADAHFFKFMLFMSYFPQILQGPIARYGHLANQLYEGHAFNYKQVCFGMQLILWGFMKKLIIADRLAIPVNQVFDNYGEYSGLIVFLAAAGYGLQVYADFSGGIDIARGFSQMVGVNLEQNFNQPYFSKSVSEFWRRWHMTLGGWMRDYVFYPLSLSKAFGRLGKTTRKLFGMSAGKKVPPFIAMFIVFFLVGFWHGADWKYITYGVWNGIFISLDVLLVDQYAAMKKRLHIRDESPLWQFFQMFRTFLLSAFGRFFSRGQSLGAAFKMIQLTFAGGSASLFADGVFTSLGLNTANWIVFGIATVVLLIVGIGHEKGISFREVIARQHIVVRWTIYLAALALVLIFGVYGTGFDSASFIYQQF